MAGLAPGAGAHTGAGQHGEGQARGLGLNLPDGVVDGRGRIGSCLDRCLRGCRSPGASWNCAAAASACARASGKAASSRFSAGSPLNHRAAAARWRRRRANWPATPVCDLPHLVKAPDQEGCRVVQSSFSDLGSLETVGCREVVWPGYRSPIKWCPAGPHFPAPSPPVPQPMLGKASEDSVQGQG